MCCSLGDFRKIYDQKANIDRIYSVYFINEIKLVFISYMAALLRHKA